MNGNKVLEIACFNAESAVIAQNSGADRIELCRNYDEGGLTPSRETILKVKSLVKIPVHVIIRPRGGNFVYSGTEIKEMKSDILFCKENNIQGVVFGVLTSENKIDIQLCKILAELAHPMKAVFHRAIDYCDDMHSSYSDLILIGVDKVLTSGGKQNAEEGAQDLKDLQNYFGNKIDIIAGGGVRSSNVRRILCSECREIHSSALTGKSEIADAGEIKKLRDFLSADQ
jgi:copper homeostasis protein